MDLKVKENINSIFGMRKDNSAFFAQLNFSIKDEIQMETIYSGMCEPDLKNESQKQDDDQLVKKQVEGDNSKENDKTEEEQAIRDAVMDNLIKKYKLNFNLSLTESPWKIAANWVKDREIIPSSAPELDPFTRRIIENYTPNVLCVSMLIF
ncbi:hypothetical protein KUTeg_022552 [Tegillarca granosa]|uniref:Uncharacterized protein n=1 Tax=Tegillarca granosa TaxID=220873 RepID=A0ABQ9ECQ6_TEGGR|nr:hypothetical protein KUTeg_022552 [Tegillarca granosa]